MAVMAGYAMMAAAAFIGGGSIVLAIAFVIVGPFAVVDLHLPEGGALLWDAALSALFFIQHSGMTRTSFRARLACVIPSYYVGLVFTVRLGRHAACVRAPLARGAQRAAAARRGATGADSIAFGHGSSGRRVGVPGAWHG